MDWKPKNVDNRASCLIQGAWEREWLKKEEGTAQLRKRYTETWKGIQAMMDAIFTDSVSFQNFYQV